MARGADGSNGTFAGWPDFAGWKERKLGFPGTWRAFGTLEGKSAQVPHARGKGKVLCGTYRKMPSILPDCFQLFEKVRFVWFQLCPEGHLAGSSGFGGSAEFCGFSGKGLSMKDLIERLEYAKGPSRVLLGEAFFALNGIWPGHIDSSHARYELSRRFLDMLEAEEWDGAGLMLVPEGWHCEIERWTDGRGRCELNQTGVTIHAWAATLSFAIAAAALKAKGVDHGAAE